MVSDNVAKTIIALNDKNKIEVMELLMNGEICACTIMEKLDLTKEQVTECVDSLCAVGIVDKRVDGEWTKYKINSDNMGALCCFFAGLLKDCRASGCECKCPEGTCC